MTGWTLQGTYCGPPPLPADLWASWNLDPALLAGLALAAWALRGSRPGLLGVAVLALAFVSPLCALSSALFAARVVHHVLLVAVAAPLLALARPARGAGPLGLPLALATAALWAWHWPGAYDLALANKAAYWLMQATLLLPSVWFWRAAFAPGRPLGPAVLAALAALVQMGLLGALLTFAPRALYAAHGAAPLDWGLTPLQDQQLGGLIMWVPAMVPYAAWGVLVARRGWREAGAGAEAGA